MALKDRANQMLVVVSNNPNVLRGETVFAGTRVPLETMLAYRREGHPIEEFLLDFPSVERWQAEAAWEMSEDEILPLIEHGARPAR